MSTLLIYILKTLIIQLVFYLVYKLLFQKTALHQWNRFYLIAALVLSLLIPFFVMPDSFSQVQTPIEESPIIVWAEESVANIEPVPITEEGSKVSTAVSVWGLLPLFYLAVCGLLLLRSAYYLFGIFQHKKQSTYVIKNWFTLFKTQHKFPFSFLSNVFIPATLFGTSSFDQILEHECAHVRQRHSLDRLLLDLMLSLFWFNPFIYWYRNALIEIHEYQADEAVLGKYKDTVAYQEILYKQLQQTSYSALVSHFNFSMIKKRIVMMNKNKTRRNGLRYLILIPTLAFLLVAFSSKKIIEPVEKVGGDLSVLMSPSSLDFTIERLTPQTSPKINISAHPSLMPLRGTELVRLSSEFGKKVNTESGVEKQHAGLDFACAVGTQVIATADAIVESTSISDTGFGKSIYLNHGNGIKSFYAHLSAIEVKEGEKVQKGQLIALSGNSGRSTAPLLHYAIESDGLAVNPLNYIQDFQSRTSKKEKAARVSTRKSESQPLLKIDRRLTGITKNEHDKELSRELPLQLQLPSLENDSSKKPLFVVDGRIRESVKDIDPQDIENIIVLKGENAAVKYGDKGVNGVVEIFTKSFYISKKKHYSLSKSGKIRFRVVLDAGHGGKDPGIIAENGKEEKEITLALAKAIRDKFENEPEIEIILTRTADSYVPLTARAKFGKNADLLISLHTDPLDEKTASINPIYKYDNAFANQSKRMAEIISATFSGAGYVSETGKSSGFYILKNANCPAVLLNISEVLNLPGGEKLALEKVQRQIANQISNAIEVAFK